MRYPEKEIYTSSSWLEYGEIIEKKQDCFFVSTPSGKISAERAFSCLIEPDIGDKVLISMNLNEDVFILAVLKRRAQNRENDIALSGNINIISRDGNINFKSQKEISLSTHGNLKFAGRDFEMHAQGGKVEVNKLSFVGKIFYGQVKTIKMVCASAHQIIGRLTQKLHNCFKFVKEQNEVQSGSSRYLVEDTLTMQSKNAVHQAEEIITINGEQIHMG